MNDMYLTNIENSLNRIALAMEDSLDLQREAMEIDRKSHQFLVDQEEALKGGEDES